MRLSRPGTVFVYCSNPALSRQALLLQNLSVDPSKTLATDQEEGIQTSDSHTPCSELLATGLIGSAKCVDDVFSVWKMIAVIRLKLYHSDLNFKEHLDNNAMVKCMCGPVLQFAT